MKTNKKYKLLPQTQIGEIKDLSNLKLEVEEKLVVKCGLIYLVNLHP